MTKPQNTPEQRGVLVNFFIEARTSNLFSIVNITSIIYCVVLILTFLDVYSKMPTWIVLAHAFGLSVIVANLRLLYKTQNTPRSAGILLFCMLMIHLVNISIVGGIDNPHFAWIFLFPILAGGTLGWKGQTFFYIVCLIGTIYFAIFPESINVLSGNDTLAYTFFTRFMCLTVFTVIMFVYYFTLSEKMQHLEEALNLASFEGNLFLGVFNSKVQSVLMLNAKGEIERANAKAHDTFGFGAQQLINKHINEICRAGLKDIKHRLSQGNISKSNLHDTKPVESRVTKMDGDSIWVEYSALCIIDDNKTAHFLITMEDISDRKNHESQLSYLARYDHLTRLPNRLSIQEHLTYMIDTAKSKKQEFAVVFFDLDKFKHVNDMQGHQAGDKVLVEVALRLKAQTLQTDVVARFGGDEFVLLMDNIQSYQQVVERIEQIQVDIAQVIKYESNEYVVNSSAGVAFYPSDAVLADELIQKADLAMYQAKSHGRGSYKFYSVEHDDCIKRQIKLGSELNFAIEREELTLLFQPIYNINDDICGAEALVRWSHDELGKVSPDEFIPISEDNGLIVPIGLWVLDESCKALKKWHDLGYKHLVMSVNISYRQINSVDMVHEVSRILSKYDLAGQSLILELTERVFADDLDLVQRNITQFAQLGVQTAIDDFGVGYSSLSYLKKTEFSSIKIDRSFIKDIESNHSARKLCAAITSMADGLALTVTAEGVETKAHLDILKEMNIQKYQGFYMSKPISAHAFEMLLKD